MYHNVFKQQRNSRKHSKTHLKTSNIVLTKAYIVLEEIQKFLAFAYVVTAVAAVTPRGNAETVRVYVVWCHHRAC